MKRVLQKPLFFIFLLFGFLQGMSQIPATRSVIIGIGKTGCGSGNPRVANFNYNGATNNMTPYPLPVCNPLLGSPGFSVVGALIDYNPRDNMIYYFRWVGTDTYVWRWAPGTCPTGDLAPFQVFTNANLTISFDADGTGWMINFVDQSTTPITYGLTLQKVDFSTGIVGAAVPIALPPGKNIYLKNGDYSITPGGKLFFAFDNKLMTMNFKDYGLSPIAATYIDTIPLPSPKQNLIGLAYADGEFVASFVKVSKYPACGYGEMDMLTGNRNAVTTTTTFSSYDNTSVTSGVGAAKKLVSLTPAGPAGEYIAVYDIFVKNYGNYPISDLQLVDSLQTVNGGAANVVSAAASLISNPAGVGLNPAYNGTTNAKLLTAGQTLKNSPTSQNNFTVRITARFKNIQSGKIYYNSAVVTGNGFGPVGSKELRDSSTNGSNPDLDLNDKPDDIGEAKPTPFVVTVAGEAPPCPTINTLKYSQDFGTGSGLSGSMPAGTSAAYSGSITTPLAEESFVITNNPSLANATYWEGIADHTGNANGRMMVVNADVNASVIFSTTVNGLCSNLKYSLSLWASNISNANQATFCNAVGILKNPKLNFRIRDAVTGLVLTSLSTGDIVGLPWQRFGMRFILPTGYSSVILEVINEGEGGCGNDLALDDIQFGLCDAQPTVNTTAISAGCTGGSTTFSAALSDPSIINGAIEYQWQSSADNILWANIPGATSATHTIPVITIADQKYYRVIVASAGNINNVSCRYVSNSFYLPLKSSSTAPPTSVSKNRTTICAGTPVQLTAHGGNFGTNAGYVWYRGSCGGTQIGTGPTITVIPTANTTYYVRIEGDCNQTACISITLLVGCDIDDDDDGIPDLVENLGLDPDLDSDADGIQDYRDPGSPGFVDSNSDGINDACDNDRDGIINSLDRDSDNDGIGDVVESYGVDVNGNGIIDNFSDSDGDGLSQQVDASASGPAGSGNGLGIPDLDGDGIPNIFDLDSDNDGISDVTEAGGIDLNNDRKSDLPLFVLATGADTNNDGRADSYPFRNMDKDAKPNPYDLDSDGDSITDLREAGYPDNDFNGMTDSGTTLAYSFPNTDGVGPADYLDIDSDNDGIPDNIEAIPTQNYQFPVSSDADGDGIDNVYDGFAGFGGNGYTPNDADADGIPDYIDQDTDNDGLSDIIEGNDFNLNGMVDDIIALIGFDTDGDGLDDRFDNNNSSAKGTSVYMGAWGSLAGDASPGSKTMVQRTFLSASERDWRTNAFVLSTKFLSVSANHQNQGVLLNWTISTTVPIEAYEVLRNEGGGQFRNVVKVTGKETYFDPMVEGIASLLQYRIKAITVEKKEVLSEIVTVKLSGIQKLTVMPNPAQSYVQVVFQSGQKQWLDCQFLDDHGRIVYQQSQPVQKGVNTIQITGLSKFARGVYLLRLLTSNHEITTQQIILR